MAELNQAKINGLDLYSSYGVGIESGLKNMDKPPELKPAQEYDWGDQNGKEYFLTDKLQDTDVTLTCFLYAATLSEFSSRKAALMTMLHKPTFKTFENTLTGSIYSVKYNKVNDFDWMKDNDGKQGARFKLELTIIRGAYNVSTVGSIYYGAVSARPTTAAQVKLLTSALNSVGSVVLATGLNRVFVIALPPNVGLASVYDNTVKEDVRSEYQLSTMPIDGQIYTLHIMENIIAYSSSHDQSITLTHG
jgi:hypothetical protein